MTPEEVCATIMKVHMAVKDMDESVCEEWRKNRLVDLLFSAWYTASGMKKDTLKEAPNGK